jgi:23S rRNA (adenine2503-C2)-methyltransferase
MDQLDMETLAVENGFPKFRGKQLYEWCHKKEVFTYDAMTNLPKNFIAFLKTNAAIKRGVEVAKSSSEEENAVKFLLRFDDTIFVEAVLMRYNRNKARDRNTLCVSTQAGCAMGCKFCATAKNGLNRNLTVGEMIDQVNFANAYLREIGEEHVSNVVYMGMGEPFDNYEAVIKSIRILNQAKDIGMRRMTVSTCGIIPGIDRLAKEKLQLRLAVSLHGAEDALRQQLMPITKKYPLSNLMASLDHYIDETNRRVTIEYALFNDVNDGVREAEKLALLLKKKLYHVNLIPGNPVTGTGLTASSKQKIAAFAAVLIKNGIETTIRESRGQDVNGACGQLKAKYTDS